MVFSHHQAYFNITDPLSLLHYRRPVFNGNSFFDQSSGIPVITSFTFSFAVSEMFVQPSFLPEPPMMAFFCQPDPLVEGLMGYSRQVAYSPSGGNQFGTQFFSFKPGSGLLLELFSKSDFLSLEAVSFRGPINSHFCLIAFGMETTFTCIPF